MKTDALIFDLDGVIVSTDSFHYQAWKRVADELGIYFDNEINHRLRGISRMESLEIVLEQYEGEELTWDQKYELTERKNEYYLELLECLTPEAVSVEVKETLDLLHSKGYKLAIGSSSKNAKLILKRIQLFDRFDAISDGTNISKSKPDPEVFVKAAKYLGVDLQVCVVIEDAPAGIDAAIAAKMKSIGIGEASLYEKADYKINDFREILAIV